MGRDFTAAAAGELPRLVLCRRRAGSGGAREVFAGINRSETA